MKLLTLFLVAALACAGAARAVTFALRRSHRSRMSRCLSGATGMSGATERTGRGSASAMKTTRCGVPRCASREGSRRNARHSRADGRACATVGCLMIRGEIFRVAPPRGTHGHEQFGARFAVIVRPIGFSTSARRWSLPPRRARGPASFSPTIIVDRRETRVLVAETTVVDPQRSGDQRDASKRASCARSTTHSA